MGTRRIRTLGVGACLCLLTNGAFGAVWQRVGPMITDLSCLSISPTYPADGTIITGGSSAYRSLDHGVTWQSITIGSGLTKFAFSSGFSSTGSDRRVFVSAFGSAFKRSTDAGATWTPVSYPPAHSLTTVDFAISPVFPSDGTIFGAVPFDLLKSSDGGLTFTVVNGISDATDVRFSPNFSADRTVFAGTTGAAGVYKSIDGGSSWLPSGNSLPVSGDSTGPKIEQMVISPAYASDQTLFVAVAGRGVYRSTNGGTDWGQVLQWTFDIPSIPLEISPNFANDRTVFTIGVNSLHFFRSNDAGDTWDDLGLFPATPHQIVASPDYAHDGLLYAATSQGLWVTSVPEPSSLILAAGFAGGLLVFRKSYRGGNKRVAGNIWEQPGSTAV